MPGIIAFGISHIWPFIRGYQALLAKGEAAAPLYPMDFRAAPFRPPQSTADQ